jgi:hypothetical protein
VTAIPATTMSAHKHRLPHHPILDHRLPA